MAIQGSGTASDPFIVTTYDEFTYAINSWDHVFSGGSTKHIAFPEIYDGPKVIDMRNRGWISALNANPPSNFSSYVHLYIHGNGWTILGISCMGNSWWVSSNSNPVCGRVTIDDLTIKNFYLLNTSNSGVALFRNDTSLSSETSGITLNRCKISGCIDAMNNVTNLEMGASTNKKFIANSCSFNIKYINHLYMAGFNNYSDNNGACSFLYNCVLNIIDQNNNNNNERNDGDYLFTGVMYYCKIVGFIKRRASHSSAAGLTYAFFYPMTPSCYNVFDFEVIDMYKPVKINNQTGPMYGIYNKDKTTDNGTNMLQPNKPDYFRGVTSAQMIDQDYLNSIDFICGDAPSS